MINEVFDEILSVVLEQIDFQKRGRFNISKRLGLFISAIPGLYPEICGEFSLGRKGAYIDLGQCPGVNISEVLPNWIDLRSKFEHCFDASIDSITEEDISNLPLLGIEYSVWDKAFYNLFLTINEAGDRIWRFIDNEVDLDLTMGDFPEVSLDEAKKKHQEALDLISKNINSPYHIIQNWCTKHEDKFDLDKKSITCLKKRYHSMLRRHLEKKFDIGSFITYPDFVRQFVLQEKRCYYLDGVLTFDKDKKPSTLSVDRIDSSLGYTKKNVVFSSLFFNYAKNQWSMKDITSYCKDLANKIFPTPQD
jgi:hypothetical protein